MMETITRLYHKSRPIGMHQKSRLLSLTILSFTLVMLSSCENISEEERYVDDVDRFMVANTRLVLIQEFTGQFCVNCPQGHTMLSNIQKLYGDNVITVGIHAGALAWDDAVNGGLKTADGDTYAASWDVRSYPSIIVNHHGAPIENTALWQSAVGDEMGKMAEADIRLDIRKEGMNYTVATTLSASTDMDAKYQLWITEDSIISIQQKKSDGASGDDGYDLNYCHNHVYRASINGIGGEDVQLRGAAPLTMQHTFGVATTWNIDHLFVVGFVYDANGLVQAIEKPIVFINEN